MRILLLSLLLCSCSSQKVNSCVTTIEDKKSILGDIERNVTCKCECPLPSANVVDAGGIVGGLLNLIKE